MTKYVDDIFCIIDKDEVSNTLTTLNAFNRQIQFTMKCETEGKLPYLDTVVQRHKNQLMLDWCQKKTASGRLINFHSNHPLRIKINTAINFINRVLNVSNVRFHETNEKKIRWILQQNDFPNDTINDLIKYVKNKGNKDHNKQEATSMVFKKTTYVPRFSERFEKSNTYKRDNYKLALKCNRTINDLFSKTKTKIKMEDKSNVLYKIKCDVDESNPCPMSYVGTTMSKLKTRLSAHKSDQKMKDKPLEQKTALAAHCTTTGHIPNFKNVEILTMEENTKRRYTLEILHIINTLTDERMNYKTDTDHCAQIYRNLIQRHKHKQDSFS
ncbi:uncharacterized protein LOC142235615 [Haematobia irritans]|uniref:uncharacterized protein LOC142235615 n=1 Tax=Haematobia irritans TaxID=7368 RepID=UPI003F4FEFD8